MNIGQLSATIVKVVIVGGCIYGIVNWQVNKPQGDEIGDFAERACIDEIRNRFDVSTLRVYAINKNRNGYVVRATLTMPRGNTANVYCLTNTHGGVKEVTINER
jgi:hypothetical protein